MSNQNATNQTAISKYIVDVNGTTAYSTIQSALDAANTAGVPALVYIRAGTYTENLTLYNNISLQGNSKGSVTITGTHVPPNSGDLQISNITLTSATHIFSSAVAGATTIHLKDCTTNVTNGYSFNLLNWIGTIEVLNLSSSGTADGFVNNTGGATVKAFNSGIGNGSANTMNLSGIFLLSDSVIIDSPINIQSSATGEINGGLIKNTLTTSATSTVFIYNTSFDTGANQAITHTSLNTLTLSGIIINSSNNPAIGGTGTLKIGSILYLNDINIAGTITQTYGTRFQTGELLYSGTVTTTPTATQNITAGIGITSAMFSAITRVQGNGAPVIVTATPNVAAGSDGQIMIIQGDSDTNTLTLQDESSLVSSGLLLTQGNNMTLGKGCILQLIYDAGDGKWYEISRSDN
jgi:hypothetical protein